MPRRHHRRAAPSSAFLSPRRRRSSGCSAGAHHRRAALSRLRLPPQAEPNPRSEPPSCGRAGHCGAETRGAPQPAPRCPPGAGAGAGAGAGLGARRQRRGTKPARAALPARSRRGLKARTSPSRRQGGPPGGGRGGKGPRDRQPAWRFTTHLREEPDWFPARQRDGGSGLSGPTTSGAGPLRIAAGPMGEQKLALPPTIPRSQSECEQGGRAPGPACPATSQSERRREEGVLTPPKRPFHPIDCRLRAPNGNTGLRCRP